MNNIPLAKPYFDECERLRIDSVLNSGCVGGVCPEVGIYEQMFANVVGTNSAIATSSCTTALHTVLHVIGCDHNSEVILPDFTFPATGFAPMYCGSKPVLADVKIDTFCIDPDDVRNKITDETTAVIAVYPFGNPPDRDWET